MTGMRWLLIAMIPRVGVFILNRLPLYISHLLPCRDTRALMCGDYDAALIFSSFTIPPLKGKDKPHCLSPQWFY